MSTFLLNFILKFVKNVANGKELENDQREYICNELTLFIEKFFEKSTERASLTNAIEVRMFFVTLSNRL